MLPLSTNSDHTCNNLQINLYASQTCPWSFLERLPDQVFIPEKGEVIVALSVASVSEKNLHVDTFFFLQYETRREAIEDRRK